ncbi:MAG: DUF397 domain-containing protein [Pseudonocardiaceae bacterium]|nr:DUF397 domain-containing protein [Pseudonocardiaceae bacterium]
MTHHDTLTALACAGGWHKSSRSQGQGGCVEVTTALPGWVGVRDTKLGADSPILAFTTSEWTAMLAGARTGEFDVPPVVMS